MTIYHVTDCTDVDTSSEESKQPLKGLLNQHVVTELDFVDSEPEYIRNNPTRSITCVAALGCVIYTACIVIYVMRSILWTRSYCHDDDSFDVACYLLAGTIFTVAGSVYGVILGCLSFIPFVYCYDKLCESILKKCKQIRSTCANEVATKLVSDETLKKIPILPSLSRKYLIHKLNYVQVQNCLRWKVIDIKELSTEQKTVDRTVKKIVSMTPSELLEILKNPKHSFTVACKSESGMSEYLYQHLSEDQRNAGDLMEWIQSEFPADKGKANTALTVQDDRKKNV